MQGADKGWAEEPSRVEPVAVLREPAAGFIRLASPLPWARGTLELRNELVEQRRKRLVPRSDVVLCDHRNGVSPVDAQLGNHGRLFRHDTVRNLDHVIALELALHVEELKLREQAQPWPQHRAHLGKVSQRRHLGLAEQEQLLEHVRLGLLVIGVAVRIRVVVRECIDPGMRLAFGRHHGPRELDSDALVLRVVEENETEIDRFLGGHVAEPFERREIDCARWLLALSCACGRSSRRDAGRSVPGHKVHR
eukprot:Amastigsp_a517062_11.p2 type:complete len:250 gc:universal Amastigsp_a517062_11:836-87(-)